MALERKDVDKKYKWDLSVIYKDEAAFFEDYAKAEKMVKAFAAHEKTMLSGAEGLYNVYMMEEVHSILAAGAGAVTKLVDYNSDNNGKIDIDRVFNVKYPYEYLSENQSEKINRAIIDYYTSKDLL